MAEFPALGRHCGVSACSQLDFLPITCDACRGSYCNAHFSYDSHSCSVGHSKDAQVPVCPLCSQPVPTPRGQLPDIAMNEHIQNNCGMTKKRIFKNQCCVDNCKKRELMPVTCPSCRLNYCLRHRHESDHDCAAAGGAKMSNARIAALARDKMAEAAKSRQMAADEALARRLAGNPQTTPEDMDLQLARQLQLEENGRHVVPPAGGRSNSNCTIA